jgi:hypothetical protein
MDLDGIWQKFIERLTLNTFIEKANWIKVTGIPFLYIRTTGDLTQSMLEKEIRKCSAIAMKGHRLHCETIFVRNEEQLYVYRHRFLVPQEKMFCCGNLCADCIRLKEKK